MTDIDCNLFPEDQACDKPLDQEWDKDADWDGDWGDKDGDWGEKHGDEHWEMVEGKMMEAQITFFFTAVGLAAGSAAQLFRYRSASNYYDDGTTVFGDTNYWELSNIIPQYFYLGMGSLAAFTQLLSIFGIGSGINLLVWMFGLGAIGGIVMAVSSILAGYGYDEAYKVTVDDTATSAEVTAAEALLFNFKFEGLMTTVEAIGMQLELADKARFWYMAEMMNMGEDEDDKDHDEWGDKEDWDEDDWEDKDFVSLTGKFINFVSL